MLDILLGGFNWRTCLIYFDEVIVFFKSFNPHLKDMDIVLSTKRKVVVFFNLKKFCFSTGSVKYVRHIIMANALTIDEVRVKSLNQLQHPGNVTKMQFFLELYNLYQQSVSNYTAIATPLTKFLRKRRPTNFSTLCKHKSQTYEKIIQAVSSRPVFALPFPILPIVIDTDACHYLVGAALFQFYPDRERKLIGSWFRSLKPHGKNYSVAEEECLAVDWAVQTLQNYI